MEKQTSRILKGHCLVRANSSHEGSASGHTVMDVLGAGCTQTYRLFQTEYPPPPLEWCLLRPTTMSLSSNSLWLREQPLPWTLPSSLGTVYTSEAPSQLQSSQWYRLMPCYISTYFPSFSAQPFIISPLQLLLSSAFPVYSCLLLLILSSVPVSQRTTSTTVYVVVTVQCHRFTHIISLILLNKSMM